jgi:hypothetical protein
MADTNSDPWATVPSAGIPEDGELEQTGVPVRDPNDVINQSVVEDEIDNPSVSRFKEIIRSAMELPENARSDDDK